ncbi:MAG: hypothetical protein HN712_03890 [Gemmatimonadetes bacterium]|nr:hypothetical protein [Gemmatimonadota bacterium]
MRSFLAVVACLCVLSCEQSTSPETDGVKEELEQLTLQVDSLRAENASNPSVHDSLAAAIVVLTRRIEALTQALGSPSEPGGDARIDFPVLSILSGDGQRGFVSSFLTNPLVVGARTNGSGVEVVFDVVEGDARIHQAQDTADRLGVAQARVESGPTAGDVTIRATAWGGSEILFHTKIDDGSLPAPVDVSEPFLVDAFEDGTLDDDLWTTYIYPDDAGTIAVEDGALLVDFRPHQATSGVSITSTWLLQGEFDVQLDYTLQRWRPENSVRVGLKAGALNSSFYTDAIIRLQDGAWGEACVTHFDNGVAGRVPSTSLTGRLRLVRTSRFVTGYCFTEDGWEGVGGSRTQMDDGPMIISVWSNSHSEGATISIDNVTLNSGTMQHVPTPPNPPEIWRVLYVPGS